MGSEDLIDNRRRSALLRPSGKIRNQIYHYILSGTRIKTYVHSATAVHDLWTLLQVSRQLHREAAPLVFTLAEVAVHINNVTHFFEHLRLKGLRLNALRNLCVFVPDDRDVDPKKLLDLLKRLVRAPDIDKVTLEATHICRPLCSCRCKCNHVAKIAEDIRVGWRIERVLEIRFNLTCRRCSNPSTMARH
jgi:hypothetical protein